MKVTNERMNRKQAFVHAVDSMRATGVHFWVEQGTLLGLVRDGDLISWDHDIDFGVWAKPGLKDFVKTSMSKSGYKNEELRTQVGCLHFVKDDSELKVDVTFYDATDSSGWTTFFVEVSGWRHTLNRAARLLASEEPRAFLHKLADKSFSRRAGRLFAVVFSSIPWKIRRRVATPLMFLSAMFPCLMICRWEVPLRFLRTLRPFTMWDRTFLVPADAEGYLAFVYGASWKTPREWDWAQETGGLIKTPFRSV